MGTSSYRAKENYESLVPPASVLARFALFVNGMARAVILPFGPTLVYHLVHVKAEVTSRTWSAISFKLALVFMAFSIGYSVGKDLAKRLPLSKQDLHHYVARLGGATIALHLFSCGAGLTSVMWLVIIRFVSAVMVGILCSITDQSSIPEEDYTTTVGSPVSNINSTEKQGESRPTIISSATAKVFLTGFAVSILSGGISYRSLSAEEAFEAFSVTTKGDHSGGGLRKFVQRVVEGKTTSSQQQRVSFKEDGEMLLGSPKSDSLDPLRPRTGSLNSVATEGSEFFDCQSDISEENSTSKLFQDETDVGQYEDGICCYSDGTPAYVTPGGTTSVPPKHFIDDARGDRNKALTQWQKTQNWRREANVWKIHTIPNKSYSVIKDGYPHWIVGHSKKGLPCVFEQPGKMNAKKLFYSDNGCTIDDMVHHYIFCQEFMQNVLCPSPELRKVAGKQNEPYTAADYGIVVVMDIAGAGVSLLSADILRYLRKVGEINAVYYPLSIKQVCVVNVPFFAGAAASTIKKVLPDSVTLDLLSGNCIDGLREHMDDDQIPPEYGGSSPYKLGTHPYEKQLEALVAKAALGGAEENNDDSAIVSSTPADMDGPHAETTADGDAVPSNATENESDLRRRGAGVSFESAEPEMPKTRSVAEGGVAVNALAFVSFYCAIWSCAQGAIEIAIPLWLSSPVRFGGLGYTPSMSGATMFVAALVVLSILRTKASQAISSIPRKDPLRALRIGLGIESAVLFVMTMMPIYLNADHNTTIITPLTITLFTIGAIACLLGRSAEAILRAKVSAGFPPQSGSNGNSGLEALLADFTSGRSVDLLCVVGEIVGVLIVSQVWALAINRDRPSKYDGSLCVLLPALMTSFLYFVSFFLLLLDVTNKSSNQAVSDDSTDLELGNVPERKAV
ncbi:SEC14 [Seminavis robusta]|uniref:SEC14 n=1 Tax=Seminavis robusta TaxID=568900 RepID=A0A9N8DNM0_9STRA|nr:SEC14 [Seminavis robusta]|eukprot:Sro229_g093110.1 SEC14 (904) ;mRNA; r:64330-67288